MVNEGLDRNIQMLEDQLAKAALGSPEQSRISESLERLYKVRMEQEKNDASFEEMSARIDKMESETADNKKTSILNTIFRGIEVGAGIIGGIAYFLFTNQAFHETLDFEQTGTPSTNSFRTIYKNTMERRNRKKK